MTDVHDPWGHLLDLAEKHPELPVKAAVTYALALSTGASIPLPDPAVADQVAAWTLRMPAVMAHVRSRKTLHAIGEIRQAGREWGMSISLGVARQACEILLGEQEMQCDDPRCNQEKGHQGACRYTVSSLGLIGPTGGAGYVSLSTEPSISGTDSPS